MSYQWGNAATPKFDDVLPDIQLVANKVNGLDNLVVVLRMTNMSWEGTSPTDQDFANFFGNIDAALTAGGWTVTVSYGGTSGKALNQI